MTPEIIRAIVATIMGMLTYAILSWVDDESSLGMKIFIALAKLAISVSLALEWVQELGL